MTSLERSVGVEDLVLLEPLVEESLLKNLQLRYENKEIYVSAPICGCMELDAPRLAPACSWSLHFLP